MAHSPPPSQTPQPHALTARMSPVKGTFLAAFLAQGPSLLTHIW
jgi:hypothetical protein